MDVPQFFFEADLVADDLAVFKERRIGGVEDDDASEAVDERILAGLQFLAEGLQAHHRRDAHRPRHNGGMRSLAADIRGEAEHELPVQLRRGGGIQIITDDDARLGDFLEVDLIAAAQ